jgi:hypothetical protein
MRETEMLAFEFLSLHGIFFLNAGHKENAVLDDLTTN